MIKILFICHTIRSRKVDDINLLKRFLQFSTEKVIYIEISKFFIVCSYLKVAFYIFAPKLKIWF